MADMVYISKRGQKIAFDDFTDNREEFHSFWVEMCPHCYNRYKDILENRADEGGTAQGICSVKGCNNEADYYVDFSEGEVTFTGEVL